MLGTYNFKRIRSNNYCGQMAIKTTYWYWRLYVVHKKFHCCCFLQKSLEMDATHKTKHEEKKTKCLGKHLNERNEMELKCKVTAYLASDESMNENAKIMNKNNYTFAIFYNLQFRTQI